MSTLTGLECPECGEWFDADVLQTVCDSCNSPLLARYDLQRAAQALNPEVVRTRRAGLWRWAELLPVRAPERRFSLGEGDAPLLPLRRIGGRLGLPQLFLKEEGLNPTGSFKARGMAVALSRAAELGVTGAVVPTAGNAGGAAAAYAARMRMPATVYMPKNAPLANQLEVRAAGCQLVLVDGNIDEAGRQAAAACSPASAEAGSTGKANVATFREPYRVEGKKTMGLELADSFDWNPPEVILYPTGGGTGLVGMWKAFSELAEMGWIGGRMPRMVSVQAEGCAPIVKGFQDGSERAPSLDRSATRAPGLNVPHPYADRLILRALRQSDGTAVAVSDEQIDAAQRQLAQEEGILACPEGAASLAGLEQLVETGWVNPDQRVVLFNTGSGLKYLS